MLDIHFIRENAELVKAGAEKKNINVDIDRLLVVDDERKQLRQQLDDKRAEQNRASKTIALAKDEEKDRLLEAMRFLKEGMGELEERYKAAFEEWQKLMLMVPNLPDITVPEGKTDADNAETRVWGEKPSFTFTPKTHVELMVNAGMADFERGAKVSGFRGYFLKGDGALLSFAIWRFLSDHFIQKGGFTPMIVPSLVRREGFMGTGYLPQSEEDLYKTQDGEYLSGTAEVATMAYHLDEVLEREALPLKYFSFSPCFRREVGAHGKDTKGLVRVHEFYKFEQVVLCEASHEESVRLHEELTKNAEEAIQLLNIPYHVVINCGGDLGLGQVKKYDIECWMPGENQYRETHSSSYFHDFQTRRLNIRYRDQEGNMRFAHSLNNTALATPRFLAVLVENYQQEDGTIRVPEVLVPYVGKEILGHSA
ncbi:serine--tRNA ligase [Patescibacteria group bacterium]|nr:serine--tRNA ligase [Patescibacteria group bacterium]MBU1500820.1 serine--tRNA ligase [Patescibacteria group bacterium]MBU2080875.1 serine--tRNA ligase [Patescibacteria group bacterium]MBU2123980.1 serine--tRNA ligase [Patescibacteria group bacterium]MBU2194729.1 serine--tRNA ligase [Patescibacteria group bacterium]